MIKRSKLNPRHRLSISYDLELYIVIVFRVIIFLSVLTLVVFGKAQCYSDDGTPLSVLEALETIASRGRCASYRNDQPHGGSHEKSDSTPIRPTG